MCGSGVLTQTTKGGHSASGRIANRLSLRGEMEEWGAAILLKVSVCLVILSVTDTLHARAWVSSSRDGNS